MRSSRRDFLKVASGVAGAAALGYFGIPHLISGKEGELIAYGTVRDGKFFVGVSSANGAAHSMIPIPFKPHAFFSHPQRSEWLIVMPRNESFSRVIDIETGNLVQEVAATPGHVFIGHGLFLPESSLFLMSEMDLASKEGLVTVRNIQNLDTISSFASRGASPHEMVIDRKNGELIIANAGVMPLMPSQEKADNLFYEDGQSDSGQNFIRSNISFFDLDGFGFKRSYEHKYQGLSFKHFDIDETSGEFTVGLKNWESGEGYSIAGLFRNAEGNFTEIHQSPETPHRGPTEFLPVLVKNQGSQNTPAFISARDKHLYLCHRETGAVFNAVATGRINGVLPSGKDVQLVSINGSLLKITHGGKLIASQRQLDPTEDKTRVISHSVRIKQHA